MRIDAHQHFLDYCEHVQDYDWMSDEHTILKRNFLPNDLFPELIKARIDATVAVQARQNLQETQWLLDLSLEYPWIVGVVGWVELCSPDVDKQLKQFSAHKKFKGVRHVLEDEPDDEFMLRADFQQGISLLQQYNLTYDLLILPKHLEISEKLVKTFPEQQFVIDHAANPPVKTGELEPWKENIKSLASHKNVYCKISGMTKRADHHRWQANPFIPYLDTLFDTFSEDRLMYGSDWPVCLLSADYQQQYKILYNYLQQFSSVAQAKVLGENAVKFYNLQAHINENLTHPSS